MRHRASRLHAVVAALLLTLGATCIAAGVASLTTTTSGPSAVVRARLRAGSEHRPDGLAPRTSTVTAKHAAHGSGPHLDLVVLCAALGAGAVLLLGWLVGGRRRDLLPRLVTASLGARAPPALV